MLYECSVVMLTDKTCILYTHNSAAQHITSIPADYLIVGVKIWRSTASHQCRRCGTKPSTRQQAAAQTNHSLVVTT